MIVTVGDNFYTNGTQSELDNNGMAYYVNPLRRRDDPAGDRSQRVIFDTFTITKSIVSPSPTPTETPVRPAATSTVTDTSTPSATATETVTASASETATVTDTPTPSATVSATTTSTSSATRTRTATPTASLTATVTRTATATRTATPPATATVTRTGTATQTDTPTPAATGTATATGTVTSTSASTATATATPLCGSGVAIAEARLDVTHNLAPAGDETLKIRGAMQFTVLTPPIDPSAHGFTLTATDANGAVLFTRFVPSGLSSGGSAPGWRASSSGWRFKDNAAMQAPGITQVKVMQRGPELMNVKIVGRRSAFQISQSVAAVRLILTMGGSAEAALGQCAIVAFGPSSGPSPLCKFVGSFDRLKCR